MTVDQINRLFLSLMLGFSVFLLLDSFVFPLDKAKGVLVNKTGQVSSQLRVVIFGDHLERTLITSGRAYSNISVNDTIDVYRSKITHSILKIGVYKEGKEYEWRTGCVFSGALNLLVFIIVSNAAYLFYFYKKIKNVQSRSGIVIVLAAPFLLFVFLYFGFQ